MSKNKLNVKTYRWPLWAFSNLHLKSDFLAYTVRMPLALGKFKLVYELTACDKLHIVNLAQSEHGNSYVKVKCRQQSTLYTMKSGVYDAWNVQ